MGAFFDMSVLASLAFLAVLLLLGVFLRAKVKFFQSFLVPACIIGGIIGAVIMNTVSIPGINQKLYEQFAYHFLHFHLFVWAYAEQAVLKKMNVLIQQRNL